MSSLPATRPIPPTKATKLGKAATGKHKMDAKDNPQVAKKPRKKT
jgi:hypothetical protein